MTFVNRQVILAVVSSVASVCIFTGVLFIYWWFGMITFLILFLCTSAVRERFPRLLKLVCKAKVLKQLITV